MKKTLFILIAVIAALSSQAQTSKGTMFAGGSFSYYYSTSKINDLGESRSYNFGVSPHFGYFLTDRFALGISADYTINKGNWDTLTSEYRSTNKSYGPGIFARYYGTIAGNFGYLIQGDFGYLYRSYERNQEPPDKVNTLNIGVKPGLYYFITPKFCLEATMGEISYTKDISKNTVLGTESTSDSFRINANLTAYSLGLNIYF